MTALATRAALAAALTTALPTVTVLDTPGAALTGPGIVLHQAGWKYGTVGQVEYLVEVVVLGGGQDPTQVLRDVEQTTAQAFLAACGAGWKCPSVGPVESMTYQEQPYIGMSFIASRVAQLT